MNECFALLNEAEARIKESSSDGDAKVDTQPKPAEEQGQAQPSTEGKELSIEEMLQQV